MTYLSRRHALVAGLGLCAATLTGTQATARPLIALPHDLVNSDAATITSISTPPPDPHTAPFGHAARTRAEGDVLSDRQQGRAIPRHCAPHRGRRP